MGRLTNRIIKIVFGSVYTIFAAEMFLRLFAPQAIVPRYMVATSYGIRGNQPNNISHQTSAEYNVEIRTNSKGIRADEEIPYDKPPGVKRIVVLGDSFAMGYEVDLKDAFLTKMQEELNAEGQNVQVVNLGVSGYGTAEELITLREEGVKYHPDLVLLVWHVSDFNDNVRCGLYVLKDHQLVRKNKTYLPGVKLQQELFRFPPYEWAATKSQLYSFVRENAAMEIVKPLLVAVQSTFNSHYVSDENDEEQATGQAKQPEIDLAVALLKEVQSVSEQAGARFLIMEIPIRHTRTEFLPSFPRDPAGGTFGFPVISPLQTLTEHADPNVKLYWEQSQGHFTPYGCSLVGDFLARQIMSRNLLASPQRSSQ